MEAPPDGSTWEEVRQIITYLEIYGNSSNVIFPKIWDISSASTMSNSIAASVQVIPNRSQYTLVAENTTTGIKLYNRLINGVETQDYFIEFYSYEGELIEVVKSSYTMSNADALAATAQLQRLENEITMNGTQAVLGETKYQFVCVDDALRLAELRTTGDEGVCCARTAFYDAFTGEVIFQ